LLTERSVNVKMSPRSKEQLESMRKQSKERILEASLELFSNQGFESTSISAIAKTAGVSKGLIYNYFEGKNHLLETILEDAMQIGEDALMEVDDDIRTPQEHLGRIIDQIFEVIGENRVFWRLIILLSLQKGVGLKMEKLFQKQNKQQIARATSIFSRMGVHKPYKEAMLLGALIDGIALQYVGMQENYPLDQQVRYLKERFELL